MKLSELKEHEPREDVLSRIFGWWFEWSDRMYYKHCDTIWWRFWFEVTGQGRSARKGKREQDKMLADFRRWHKENHEALRPQPRPKDK